MSTSKPVQLGWVGLGSMGLAMALNLQKHLQSKQLSPLLYWNRTIARGQPLLDSGGKACPSAENVVSECDVIFISLSDDAAIESLINSIPPSLLTSKILVDTTTISPSLCTSLTTLLKTSNCTYISAPVFGSTPVASTGQLLIALGGPAHAIALIKPYLQDVLARGIIEVGDEPRAAIMLKTTGNYITAGLRYVLATSNAVLNKSLTPRMLLLSEAHTLASLSSLPAPVLHSLISSNFGSYAASVSERLISGAYCPPPGEAPRSGLELGIKDVGNGVKVARENGMHAQIGEMYLDATGEARVWGEERGRRMDSSSVFGVVRRRAGLGFEIGDGEGEGGGKGVE